MTACCSSRSEHDESLNTTFKINLEPLLRGDRTAALVLFGIATSGVVCSTLVDAADADYKIAGIKDCCTDLNGRLV